MGPIVKRSLALQVYDDLRHRILTQEIAFGEKLTNRDLQVHYGVSSTPVRDAVNSLHRDGLVEFPTRTGAKVITFDLKHALDINEVLSLLGVAAVSLCADRAPKNALVDDLLAILEKQETSTQDDTYYDYDRQFHSAFFQHSGNEELKSVHMRYHALHEMLVRYYHKVHDTRKMSVGEHRQIVEAYARGDIELARKSMESHYQAATFIFRRVLGPKSDR